MVGINQMQTCKRLAAWLVLIAALGAVMPLHTAAAGEAVSVTLPVEQVFHNEGNAADISTVFPYELIAENADTPMPSGSLSGSYAFTMDGSAAAELGPFLFTAPGDYRYSLRQSASAAGEKGYLYDEQVYSITIYVMRSGSGFTTQTIAEKEDGSKTDTIRFENSYRPLASKPDLMRDPPIKKTVSGAPARDSTFVFRLSAGDPANPMPQGSENGAKTLSITGSGEKEFGTWAYTKAGVYYYTISEENTHELGYTYDTAVYTITDVVKAVDGELTVSRTVTNSANKPVQSCIFINTYSGPAGGTGIIGPKTGDSLTETPYWIALAVSLFAVLLCVRWLVFLRRRRGNRDAGSE